jgi:ADP-heptose:LPS heptosyltransferase
MPNLVRSIELVWREWIVNPVLRIIVRNQHIDKPIDISSVKKLLILRHDRIGDMIITTPILRNLKQINPDLKIGILAGQTNAEIIKHNPYVDDIYVFTACWHQLWRVLQRIRREKYDVILNFVFTKMTLGGILINLMTSKGMKIGLGEKRYGFYYNRLLSFQRDNGFMIELLVAFVKHALGADIPLANCKYEIVLDDATRTKIQGYMTKYKLASRQTRSDKYLPYIVLNLSASDQWTKLSIEQVESICTFLDAKKYFRTVIIYAPDDRAMENASLKICTETSCLLFPENGKAALIEIAALIEGASCVITPDTSIVHFASAMGTPLLAFYSSAKEKKEWLPFRVEHRIVWSENNLAASSIPSGNMIGAIDDFLSGIKL